MISEWKKKKKGRLRSGETARMRICFDVLRETVVAVRDANVLRKMLPSIMHRPSFLEDDKRGREKARQSAREGPEMLDGR